MGLSLSLLAAGLSFLVLAALLQQRAELTASEPAFPARQIAYNMRLYHQAAIAFKTANPASVGPLPLAPPAFLTEWRFTACAGTKSVVTYGNSIDVALSRDINAELLRQAVAPPELGAIGAPSSAAIATGIGMDDGTVLNTGAGAIAPVCPLSAGMVALQTQVLP